MLDDATINRLTMSAEQVLSSFDCELVDIEVRREGRKLVLCLYIDKPGGVSLDDCATVSHEFSAVLDADDVIAERYTLEVSSPGLNRPLKKMVDYERTVGKLVRIKTTGLWQDEVGNKRKTFLGHLAEVRQDEVVVNLLEGQLAVIPLAMVAKANLEYEF